MANKKEFFVCLRVSRDDFSAAGFDASKISDEQMQEYADKIGESCTGEAGTFWTMIEYIGEEESLPELDNGQRP